MQIAPPRCGLISLCIFRQQWKVVNNFQKVEYRRFALIENRVGVLSTGNVISSL